MITDTQTQRHFVLLPLKEKKKHRFPDLRLLILSKLLSYETSWLLVCVFVVFVCEWKPVSPNTNHLHMASQIKMSLKSQLLMLKWCFLFSEGEQRQQSVIREPEPHGMMLTEEAPTTNCKQLSIWQGVKPIWAPLHPSVIVL